MKNLEDKLDKVIEDINEIKISQARTEVIMDEHIKRTGLNEENLSMLRKEFKPVKAHVMLMNSTAKVVAMIAAAIGFLASVGWLKPILDIIR